LVKAERKAPATVFRRPVSDLIQVDGLPSTCGRGSPARMIYVGEDGVAGLFGPCVWIVGLKLAEEWVCLHPLCEVGGICGAILCQAELDR